MVHILDVVAQEVFLKVILKQSLGNSLAVQWLGRCTSTAGGPGSIPAWGTKILQAVQSNRKKPKNKKQSLNEVRGEPRRNIREKSLSGSGISNCKDLDMRAHLICSRSVTLE